MRRAENVFHLAIPSRDLDETRDFYEGGLGCRVARRYADRITLDFFGDQVVCHLAPDAVDPEPRMYPRHFGVTFRTRDQYDSLLSRARRRGLPFFEQPFTRFENSPEEHSTFFLVDPSNNLLEFKHYRDPGCMY